MWVCVSVSGSVCVVANKPKSPRKKTPNIPSLPLPSRSSVQRNSYHGYLQIAVVVRRHKLVQTAVAVGREDAFTGGVRIVILRGRRPAASGATWSRTGLLLSGASVSPSSARVRLNCRSSVARLRSRLHRNSSTAGTTGDPLRLSGSHRRRRKRIDLFAKQRIVPAAAASLAVFVH